MHDEKLTRTTNVQTVFPERATLNSTAFNWTDLQQLNAGSWFLEVRVQGWVRWGGEEGSKTRALPCVVLPLQSPEQCKGALSCLHGSLGCSYTLCWLLHLGFALSHREVGLWGDVSCPAGAHAELHSLPGHGCSWGNAVQ